MKFIWKIVLDKCRPLLGWILLGLAVGFLIASIINFQKQIPTLPRGLYDSSIIPVLNQISRLIPQNETIVVSDHAPVSQYFTKHYTKIPNSAYSEKTLFDYMNKNKYRYLLVYEGTSEVRALSPLFSYEGLKNLNNHFNEITFFQTQYSNIYLYQRKN